MKEERDRYELSYGEKAKWDEKDSAIIQALYDDGRMLISKIAKRTGLPRDSVNYRIKRMLKLGIIQGFMPIVNPPKIGFSNINSVLLALQNFNTEIEKRFVKKLKSNPNIVFVANLIGKWDYEIIVVTRNAAHFNLILKDIRENFANNIKDYEIMTIINTYKYENYSGLFKKGKF